MAVSRDKLMATLKEIEHPEIAATLMKLGMILDAAVKNDEAVVAMALPMMGIPEAVRNALVESIRVPVEKMGLTLSVQFFEMTPEAREQFFEMSQANWKGSI